MPRRPWRKSRSWTIACKAVQVQLDTILSQQNAAAKNIGRLMAQGQKEQAEAAKAEVAMLKQQSKQLDEELKSVSAELNALIVSLPNFPADIVPHGMTAADNLVVKLDESTMPSLGDDALPHWELAAKYDIIDFELGVKLTGAGFPVYKGKGARCNALL